MWAGLLVGGAELLGLRFRGVNVHVPMDDGWAFSHVWEGDVVGVEGLSMVPVPYGSLLVCDDVKLRRMGRYHRKGGERRGYAIVSYGKGKGERRRKEPRGGIDRFDRLWECMID